MSNTKTEGQFWMVWNPQGNAPRYQHAELASAKSEARRLAISNPGKRFIVLAAIWGCVMPSPGPDEIVFDDGIPF